MTIKEVKYITVKDFADKIGLSLQTVYIKINNKELETKKILNTTLIKL